MADVVRSLSGAGDAIEHLREPGRWKVAERIYQSLGIRGRVVIDDRDERSRGKIQGMLTDCFRFVSLSVPNTSEMERLR